MIGSEDEFEAGAAAIPDVIEPIETPGEVLPPAKPPEQTGEIPLETFITKDLVGMLFSLPGYIMAKRTGHDLWLVSESEKRLLGEAAHPAVIYLVRKYLGDAGPMAAIGAGLAAVYGPKMLSEMEAAKQDRQNPGQPKPVSPPPKAQPPASMGESPSSPESPDAGSQSSSSEYRTPFTEF